MALVVVAVAVVALVVAVVVVALVVAVVVSHKLQQSRPGNIA